MSLSTDITTLNSALQSFTYAQGVISENIANAQTVGYTSEVTNLESLNDFGGVAVAGVGSTRDTFLYNQIYSQLAQQGFSTAQLIALQQIANILPEVANPNATGGLNSAINNLASAWTALSLAPTSTADQAAVLGDMQTLTNLFNVDSNQFYILQQNLNTQLQQTITQVNSLEDQILTLNKQIVDAGGQQNAQTSTLIDQREVAAETLAGLTGANINYNTNGSMIVTFLGGTLVDGVQSYHLAGIPSQTVPGQTDIGYVSVPDSSEMADVTADFTGGTLGGLLAGQQNVHQAVLAINQMASGIIQFSNEVNESSAAPDGSLNALFYGSDAGNISVNPNLQNNLDYILSENDPLEPGNLAAVQGAMNAVNMYSEIETFNPTPNTGGIELNQGTPINPQASMASQAALFSNPAPDAAGVMIINSGGIPDTVTWNSGMSLNQIVQMINQNGAGAVYATLQTVPTGATIAGQPMNVGQFIHIYTNGPASVYDQSGNLASVLQLSSVLVSSAPINATPTDGVNQVNPNFGLNYVDPVNPNTVDNPLALFTQPVTPDNGQGTATVDNDPATVFPWNSSDSINTILGLIENAAPAGTTVYAGFSQPPLAPDQEVALFNVINGPMTINNQLQSVGINDLTGNLTQVLNLNTNTNASKLFAQLTTTVKDNTAAATAEQTQATSLVTATQNLQNQQSQVNTATQLAQAAVYQNAYDAAARMQYVLESMLNFLITQTGSPSAGSSTQTGS